MKSTVDAAEFAAAVKRVSGILKKSKIPLFSQARAQFADDACRVSATDGEAWLSTEIPATGEQFSFLFRDTQKLLRVLRHYEGSLTVELLREDNETQLSLQTSTKAGTFPALEDEAYEEVPRVIPLQRYEINPKTLYERVERVRYATRIREDKPATAGVRFQDKRIWCVDGCRLAIHEDAALNVTEPFILRASVLKYLSAFETTEGELLVGERYAAITANGLTLACRLMEQSDELKIDMVMPKTAMETYSVNRRQYLDALNYLADCTNRKENVAVGFDGTSLIVYDKHGEYAAKVDIAEGRSEVCYAVNLTYMRQAVEHMKDVERVRIDAISASSPIVLHGGSMTAMVLPVRMKVRQYARAA